MAGGAIALAGIPGALSSDWVGFLFQLVGQAFLVFGGLLLALIVGMLATMAPEFSTKLSVPFFKNFTPDPSWGYVPFAALVIVGAVVGLLVFRGGDDGPGTTAAAGEKRKRRGRPRVASSRIRAESCFPSQTSRVS